MPAALAGAVLAARLSEAPGLRVILVEAGPGIDPANVPAVLASQYAGRAQFNPDWFWNETKATFGELQNLNQPGAKRGYEQPRVLGGGSSVNGIGANRDSRRTTRSGWSVVRPAGAGRCCPISASWSAS